MSQEFGGRAHQIKSFVRGSDIDDVGHGTHCAGTVGSATYGVAKKVELYGVKVSNSDGKFAFSDLIAAFDFIVKDMGTRDCPNGVVVSCSMGGEYSKALNDATDKLVGKGVFFAAAAGNDNAPTSGISPASASKACAVGGSDSGDRRYVDSNYGPEVNIIAPGVDVYSTLPGGRVGSMTGTSMAAPHIAGLAAYIAARDNITASGDLCNTIVAMGTTNAIRDQYDGTTSTLAFNGNPAGDYPPADNSDNGSW